MKIEEGKFYKDAKGNKVGPMKMLKDGGFCYKGSYAYFKDDGRNPSGFYPDLIEEWVDTPRTFRQLTDAEKGALLLAHHEGKRIWCSINGKYWSHVAAPSWASGNFYRIAPTRVARVTGTCEVGPDGKPDFDTWEEV